jgi:hypothetical protein
MGFNSLFKGLKYKSSNCEIGGFQSVIVLLVGRFEDLKPNIPDDQYPESSHEYLQYIVVCLRILYCDGGTREKVLKAPYISGAHTSALSNAVINPWGFYFLDFTVRISRV